MRSNRGRCIARGGSRRQAGGKGVNFARALRSLGPLGLPDDPPLVVGFASGRAGETIREGLDEERIDCDLVSFPGESRTCTIVLDLEGEATVVNEAGPPIEDASRLLAVFESRLEESRAVAFMGSLPPGIPPALYAEMIARARQAGRWCLLDTSGEALRRGLDAGPNLAKPNRREAEELLGFPLSSDGARREGVERIRSLGACDGSGHVRKGRGSCSPAKRASIARSRRLRRTFVSVIPPARAMLSPPDSSRE